MKYSAEVTGKIIYFERTKHNWSQAKLGKKIGVVGKQISNYEKGILIPPIDVLVKMCEEFDCELGYLLGEKEYSEKTKLQTHIQENMGLTLESMTAIRQVMGLEGRSLPFRVNEKQYNRVVNAFISSPWFRNLISDIGKLDSAFKEQRNLLNPLVEEYGGDLVEKAWEIRYGNRGYVGEDIDPVIIEIIQKIDQKADEHYKKSFVIKVARYELGTTFEKLIEEMYPKDKYM